MKVVLDTNVLLIALPSRSPYHPIIRSFSERLYELVITTPIFLEYEEILSKKANPLIAKSVLGAFLEASNIIRTTEYYRWNLVDADQDDNKFTDAYMNGQADYLVTNDVHFNSVRRADFPKISVITADEFLNILNSA